MVFKASTKGQPYFTESYRPGVNQAGELFEAVLGAVYLDGGMRSGRSFFGRVYKLPEDIEGIPDPAALLQEQIASAVES